MRNRVLASLGSVALSLPWRGSRGAHRRPERLGTQGARADRADRGKEMDAPPKTSWGDPDLQGAWNSQTSRPLERPAGGRSGEQENLTDQEAAAFEAANRKTFDESARAGDTGTYNAFLARPASR